ncbi:MAG: amidohydrolase [Candidatus Heimdallarchaeaceae archaeon]
MELVVRGRLAIFYDKRLKLHFIKDPAIIVEDQRIIDIGKYQSIKSSISGHDKIGDDNQLLIPGLINTHTHLAMTLFRGIADDLPLNIWLTKHIWPLENKLKAEDVLIGAKLGVIESLLSGVTTLNSMYWYPEEEARAIEELNMRGMIGAPVITGISNLNSAIRIATKLHNTARGRIKASLSLHAPYTVTISDFKKANEYILDRNRECAEEEKILIHTHLAEPKNELEQAQKFNFEKGEQFPEVKSSVELLDKIELLHPYLLAAHCIHVNKKDILKMKEAGMRVALNPLSNSKLGNVMPPLPLLIKEITNLGIGTDGPASNNTLNLFETIRYLALFYKGLLGDPSIVKAEETFKLATIGGAKALNWQGIGTLEKGSLADIVTINLKKPHLTPITSNESVLSHFAYAMNGNDVENVIVDGKLLIKNRDFETVVVENIMEEVQQSTQNLLAQTE